MSTAMPHFDVYYKGLYARIDNDTLEITKENSSVMDDTVCINDTDPLQDCAAFCTGPVAEFATHYRRDIHVYFALVVCLFGTIANILNIAVLTRKDMACAPINRILTGLAVADMLVMIEYIPFAYYFYILLPGEMNYPYWGAVLVLFHTHFAQVLHTISIFLTLTLAIWRYLAIGYPDQNHILCSERRCFLGITISYFLPILLCFPTYFIFIIKKNCIIEDDKKYTLFALDLNPIVELDDSKLLLINFWVYAVLIKLLPCCILTVITCWLIRTLFIAKKRKQVLRGYNACPTAQAADGNQNIKKTKAERRADRTTKMLVAVLLLFLITEFPQGIFSLIISLNGVCVFKACYIRFGEIMDILALLNGSINFILYCCMNRMFRLTFGQLFRTKILAKWVPPNHSDVYTTSHVTDSTKV